MLPLVAGLGTTELLIILAVLILLFGASKLPELARGSGRALRIFKAETKGLMDDDDLADKADAQHARQPVHPTEIHQPGVAQQPPAQPYVDPVQRTRDH